MLCLMGWIYGRFPPYVVLFWRDLVRMCSVWMLIVLIQFFTKIVSWKFFWAQISEQDNKFKKNNQTLFYHLFLNCHYPFSPFKVECLVFSRLISPVEDIHCDIDILWQFQINFLFLSVSSVFSLAGKVRSSTKQMGLHEEKKK